MKYKWGELISLEYGKPVKDKAKSDGKYPVFGTNGQIGTSDLPPLCNHASFILGRKGAYRGVHYSPVPFSVIDTAFYAENLNPYILDIKWAYYKFLTYDINNMDSGSAIPSTDRYEIYSIKVDLPDLKTQRRIVRLLECFDDKIALNNKINENLEQQAQALYHEWFECVDRNSLPSGWKITTLDEIAEISKRVFNPAKEQETMLEHYSIPAFDERKFPVFEISSQIKSNKYIVDNSCLLISKLNPTIKRVWKPYCLTNNAVCSTEFIVYRAKDKELTDFLYSVIDSATFSDFMCSHVTGSTGSRQRTTPTDTLAFEFVLPKISDIQNFQHIVSPMYKQMKNNAVESQKLMQLRDSLLPKLMNGVKY